MLALVNVVAMNAFAMRFVREEKISKVTEIEPGSGEVEKAVKKRGPREWTPRDRVVYPLLQFDTQSMVCDAMLIVRPYFRVVRGLLKKVTGRLFVSIDGDVIVNYEPLAKYLIAGSPEEYSPDKPVRPEKGSCLFLSSFIDEYQQAAPNMGYYGIMAPNASSIFIKVADLELGKAVTVEAGCVAATYSTKAEKEGEKEEPREVERS
jgi:hypothetical protein